MVLRWTRGIHETHGGSTSVLHAQDRASSLLAQVSDHYECVLMHPPDLLVRLPRCHIPLPAHVTVIDHARHLPSRMLDAPHERRLPSDDANLAYRIELARIADPYPPLLGFHCNLRQRFRARDQRV